MASNNDPVCIKIPKTIIVKDGTAGQIRRVIGEMLDVMVKNENFDADVAKKIKAALFANVGPEERDYPVEEMVETILNTAPQFTGGRTKVQRIAFRIQAAFEGAKEGQIVKLDPTAHDMLKAFFEKPEYVQVDQKSGERKTVEGVVFGSSVWRNCCPYADAICDPMKDEPPPAEPAPVTPPA